MSFKTWFRCLVTCAVVALWAMPAFAQRAGQNPGSCDKFRANLEKDDFIVREGEAIHFEVPVASGRDRTARLQARLGDVCFWSGERRVIIAFGQTPISRPDEIRMPSPVNVFATALDDVGVLRDVRVGEKVVLSRSS